MNEIISDSIWNELKPSEFYFRIMNGDCTDPICTDVKNYSYYFSRGGSSLIFVIKTFKSNEFIPNNYFVILTKDELTEHFKILLRTLKLKKITNGII